ncbi:cupin domain-containing protein [Mangrovimicrobium sediminis]|uniref:cupin domain-containing protein n=1 Tax=Mangrovimicrobium sediminis TaxID=2562682 RepID=UPI001F0EE826|nr:cupin domain-containing protein [Haliea sp. SAOS-164]
MNPGDLFADLPESLSEEAFEDLLRASGLRIERIVSQGHTSPEQGWYDQAENEWVLVLRGAGRLQFDDGEEVYLRPGQYLTIPAHRRHRVSWTSPDELTVWLAVFYP